MAESEAAKLERLVWIALEDCTLPSPHKRGILNHLEGRLRLQEQVARNADKLQRIMKKSEGK